MPAPDFLTPEGRAGVPPLPEDLGRERHQEVIAASLAAGMIAARGTPHTAEDAIKVLREVLALLRQ
jgi:hypothetical protein